MSRTILDLCGGSGAWSKPYREAGYDVRVITTPEYDVRLFPSISSEEPRHPRGFDSIEDFGKVHGVLAAPPCTVFSGSGATWKRTDAEMIEGLSIVDACLRIITRVTPQWWALENPVGKLRKWLGPPTMTFQPSDYGDPYTKRTLLWGEFNPPKKQPIYPLLGSVLNRLPPSEDRAQLRSITPQGFAKAFFEANP